MRRRLTIVASCAAVVLVLAVALPLTGGSGFANPVLSGLALGVAILAFVIGLLAMIFAIVLPLFGSPQSFLGRPALEAAIAAGRSGLARVAAVRPTGAQINGQWVYDAGPAVAVLAGPGRTAQDALVPQDAPPWS